MGDGFHGIDVGVAEQAVHLVRTATTQNFEVALDELARVEQLVGGCVADRIGPIRRSASELCGRCSADADTLEQAIRRVEAADVWPSPVSWIGDGPAPPPIRAADRLQLPKDAAERIMGAFRAVRASLLATDGASEAILRGWFGDLVDADAAELLARLDEYLEGDRDDDLFAEWDFGDFVRTLQWMQLVVDGEMGDPALRDELIERMDEGTLERLLDELPALRDEARALGYSGEQFDQLVMEPVAAMLAAAGRSSDPSAYTELAAQGYPIIDLMTVAPDYFTDDEIAAAAQGAVDAVPPHYPLGANTSDEQIDTAAQALALLSDRPDAAQIFFGAGPDSRKRVLTDPRFDVHETRIAIVAALDTALDEEGGSYQTGMQIMADITSLAGEGETFNAAARRGIAKSLQRYFDDIAVDLDRSLENVAAGDRDPKHTVSLDGHESGVVFDAGGMVDLMGQLVDDNRAERTLQRGLVSSTRGMIGDAGTSSDGLAMFERSIEGGFQRSRNLLFWAHAGFQRHNDSIGDPAWGGFLRGVAKGLEWASKGGTATSKPALSPVVEDLWEIGDNVVDWATDQGRDDEIAPSTTSSELADRLKVETIDAIVTNDDLRDDYGLSDRDAREMSEVIDQAIDREITYDRATKDLSAIARGGGEDGEIDPGLGSLLEDLPGFDVPRYVPD